MIFMVYLKIAKRVTGKADIIYSYKPNNIKGVGCGDFLFLSNTRGTYRNNDLSNWKKSRYF